MIEWLKEVSFWGSAWSLEQKGPKDDFKSLNWGKEDGNGKEKDFHSSSKLESSGFNEQVQKDMKEKGVKDYTEISNKGDW